MRYQVIATLHQQYPVTRLCEALEVSESGYYTWAWERRDNLTPLWAPGAKAGGGGGGEDGAHPQKTRETGLIAVKTAVNSLVLAGGRR